MFKCATCKTTFEGTPALTNGAGMFCSGCDDARIHKLTEATRARYAEMGHDCMWCGEPGPHKDSSGLTRVCNTCDNNRGWLLRCIRHSNRAADYVAKTEDRELPLRRDRQAKEAAARLAANEALANAGSVTAAPVLRNEANERLDRLEQMIMKLTEALGGV